MAADPDLAIHEGPNYLGRATQPQGTVVGQRGRRQDLGTRGALTSEHKDELGELQRAVFPGDRLLRIRSQMHTAPDGRPMPQRTLSPMAISNCHARRSDRGTHARDLDPAHGAGNGP